MFLVKNFKYLRLGKSRNNLLKFSTNLNFPVAKDRGENLNENLGQPTPWTHPHLLNEGEVVPGIRPEEFRERRCKLLENIQKFAVNSQPSLKNHIVVIPSSVKKYMSDKIPYVFRQNSDFFYLSGCLEPNSVLVLSIDENKTMKSTLFMRPKDKHAELWDGPRTGIENSPEFFGVDEAYDVDKLKAVLEAKKLSQPLIWYDEHISDQHELTPSIKSLVTGPGRIQSPTTFIHRLRLFKSPSEVELMRKTCQIASESINEVMNETRPGDSEHEIFARTDYKCRIKGASYLAYPPVVATGRNATTIHYINNTQLTRPGELVLMDAGCEYAGYTSDITRTWPVDGRFTEAQKVLYDVVLLLQKDLINTLLKPGGMTLDDLFDTMCLRLGKYLQEVGLVAKDLKGVALAKAAYSFCPHHVSHYLGMDVHDTPLMSRSMKLAPGMVCTVEPGVYIAADRRDVPQEFRGIGIRIEDDVLITSDDSVEVLTEKCLKERRSIERIN